MKKIIFLLSSVCALFSIVSCNHDSYEVNDEEWNEAIENIVNYKKDNNLNYVATGDLVLKNDEVETHISTIESSNGIDRMTSKSELGKMVNFSKKIGKFYFNIETNQVSENRYYVDTSRVSDFFNLILDLYDNKDSFDFKRNRYIIKKEEEEIAGTKFYVSAAFKNKKIYEIVIDYDTNPVGKEFSLKGKLSFTYGTSSIGEEVLPTGWDIQLAKYNFDLNENDYSSETFKLRDSFICNINAGASIGDRKTLKVINTTSLAVEEDIFVPYKHYVYKNDVLLEEGTDYELTKSKPETETHYSYLTFKEVLKEGDKVQIYANHNKTSTSSYKLILDVNE